MPRGGDPTAGTVVREAGAIRLRLTTVGGIGFDGGHPEDKGVTSAGQVIPVPLHRHTVSLDFFRIELGLELTVAKGWDVWLRAPYEVKIQRTGIKLVQPIDRDQALAIVNNQYIHHRDETYYGPGDLQLLGARRLRGLLADNDQLTIALGFTLPTGKTEEDPFIAGDEGRKHLHIQFGSGTVDPLLELSYYTPLPLTDLSLNGSVVGRFPLYENDKTYQAPIEVTGSVGLVYRLTDLLSLFAETNLFFQSYGHWDGRRDENSGLISWNGGLSLLISPLPNVTITLGVRLPITQQVLLDRGEAFERGPTFLLDVSWLIP